MNEVSHSEGDMPCHVTWSRAMSLHFDPTPFVDFSPYPWSFSHETINRIEEYVQKSMYKGTPQLACNIAQMRDTFLVTSAEVPWICFQRRL